jgi:vitamin B12 transporter
VSLIHFRLGCCLAAVVCLVLMSPIHGTAAPAATTMTSVHDTLTVSAPRPERHLGGISTVTVVELDGTRSDLAELLEDVSGVQIRRYGGLGAPTIPSIRGSSATQVTILVDGMPLSDAQTGVLDLSTLPLDRFVRAEVFRGGLPAHFGAPGGVGAINLVTRDAGRGRSELQLSTGSFGEAGGRLVTHGEAAGLSALVLVHGRRSDGQFRYLDDNWTPFNPDDDQVTTRTNAWFHETGGSMVIKRKALTGPRVRLALGIYSRNAGRPGPYGGAASPDAETHVTRHDLHLSLADSKNSYGLDFSMRRDEDQLDDPNGNVGWDPPGTTSSRSDHWLVRAHGTVDATLPMAMGEVAALASCDLRQQRFLFHQVDRDDPARERSGMLAGLDLQWTTAARRFTVWPSLRWQRHEDDFPALPALPHLPPPVLEEPHIHEDWAPSLAVVWEAKPGRLFLEARRFRSRRTPTWVELFGQLGGAAGNRELLPEQVDGREVAFRLHDKGLRVRWAIFQVDVDDAIVWRINSQLTSKPENIGQTRVTGHELELALDLGSQASAWVSLTQQETIDLGDDPTYAGHELLHQPAWTVVFGGQRRWGHWSLRGRLLHEAGNWSDRYNGPGARVPSRTLVSTALSYDWTSLYGNRDMTLSLEGLNLTDDLARDVDGYPLPGRSVRATLTIQ